jgi:hypothetical protein
MKIELCDGKYVLKSDAYCMWIAKSRKSEETGTEYDENISGYHPTLGSLIDGMMRKAALGSGAESLQALRRDIEAVADDLKRSVGDLEKYFAAARKKDKSPSKKSL